MFSGIFGQTLALLSCVSSLCTATPTSSDQIIIPAGLTLDTNRNIGNVNSRPPVRGPYVQLQAYTNVLANLAQSHPITIPEGTRVNVQILGGNWTRTDGKLLATVVPDIGAEQGYIDTKGLFHLDVRYTIQFASDKKFGYVQLKGFGKAGVSNKVWMVVETDSVQNQRFTGTLLYSPGSFTGNLLRAPVWAFVDPPEV